MESRMDESHTSTSRSTERSTAVVVSAGIADQYANQLVSTLYYTDTYTHDFNCFDSQSLWVNSRYEKEIDWYFKKEDWMNARKEKQIESERGVASTSDIRRAQIKAWGTEEEKKLSTRKENRLKNKSNELLMTVLKIEKQIDTERRKKNQINGPLKSWRWNQT